MFAFKALLQHINPVFIAEGLEKHLLVDDRNVEVRGNEVHQDTLTAYIAKGIDDFLATEANAVVLFLL